MERPVTSKSRGICSFYKEPQGCFSGDHCKFLHAEPEETEIKLTPYDQAKKCRYYAHGFCKRGDKCWFKHEACEDNEELCSICFDRPATYGLLTGCTHVFCINCIKRWRASAAKKDYEGISKVTKLCPICRVPSKYITPSSIFYQHDDPRKQEVLIAYKESMGRIPCRYFQRTKEDSTKKPFCPFGKDCFYQHLNLDGTRYVFSDGVDVCMMRTRPFTSLLQFNYHNPLGNQSGSVAAEHDGTFGNLHIDLDDLQPSNPFPRSVILRHSLRSRRLAPPYSPARNHAHDDVDVPSLVPVDRHSPSHGFQTDDSMPIRLDMSEQERASFDPSESDDRNSELGLFVASQIHLEAANRNDLTDVLAFVDEVDA